MSEVPIYGRPVPAERQKRKVEARTPLPTPDRGERPVPPGREPPAPAPVPAPVPPTRAEPGFGEVLSGLFTPPAPTVIPTPYDGGGGAPGGSTALLGALVIGGLGFGAWHLWKRRRAVAA